MADSDDSYNFLDIYPFLVELRAGNELVMGNRFKGGIQKGAMPFLNRYLGNPVLSFIGRLFFGSKIGDFHCGMRAFTKEAFLQMNLQTTGMEFATEMIVKATLGGLKMTEIPIQLHPDGRNRDPHLRRWRDGWRHLRFMALYAPAWIFLYPGLILLVVGGLLSAILWWMPLNIEGVVFDIGALLYTCLLTLIGFQFILYYYKAHIYAVQSGLLSPKPSFYKQFHYFTLERGLIAAALLLGGGVAYTIYALQFWQTHQWGDLQASKSIRMAIPGFMGILVGIQLFLSSIFFSILGLHKKNNLSNPPH
jgi:hypothetical protein